MPHIHYKTVQADAVGTVAKTREKIDDIYLSAKATDLLGFFLNSAGAGTTTAAEAIGGKFELELPNLAPRTLKTQTNSLRGGGPATNIGGYISPPKWFPFKPMNGATVANKKMTVYYNAYQNAGSDVTEDQAAQVAAVYAEGAYPAEVMGNIGQLRQRMSFVDNVLEDDLGGATSETIDESPMTIPGDLSYLAAIGINLTLDAAPTQAEELLGYVSLSGTVPGLDDMDIPIPSVHSSLGTPVGAGLINHEYILPLYIQIPARDVTLNFTANLLTDITATGLLSVDIYGRDA